MHQEWDTKLKNLQISSITLKYCPGHAIGKSNEMDDHLADHSLSMEKEDIIKAILSKPQSQENTEFEETMHHQHLL